MIKDNEGNEYKTIDEYYNSPMLDDDIIYNYLARGLRTPQNEKEERWAEEGRKLLKQGSYEIDFE